MGNAQSNLAHRKLSKELPPTRQMGLDDNYDWKDFGPKIFVNEQDREQFISAVIAVATSNGLIDLSDHDFKLMYSRREGKEERVVACIVAVKDGVITAKIEPEMDGKDQIEALKALRRDVEIKLDGILREVPDRSNNVGAAAGSSSHRVDAPPAYSGPGVGVVNAKPG